MTDNNLSETNKEELKYLLHSIVEDSIFYYFVSDDLNKIISAQPCPLGFNLTTKYNLRLIFHCLKQYRYLYKQIKFLNKPNKKQLLERKVTIMAQYFLPHISYSIINKWLDGIAQEVLCRLKKIYPKHSIFSIPSEQFSFWIDNNIDDNFWNSTETRQIMCVLEEYIFSVLDIRKLYQLLIIPDSEIKYLNISELFQRHVLTATCYIVARRHGIHCILMEVIKREITYKYRTIQIVWKSNNTEDWGNAEYLYMKFNPFQREESNLIYPSNIIRGRYPNENPSDIMFTTIDDINELNDINDISDIVHHWQKDIIEDLFEKLNYEIRNIHNIDYRWKWHMLSQILCHYSERDDLDLEYNAYYDKITQIIEVRSDVVKRKQLRKENIKFAVGMIVTHIRPSFYPFYEEDHHHGVIIGWHNEHNRTWICEMKEDHLYTCTDDKDENIVDQPYYLILSEDNRICYWQQDLISICTPKWINNVEIGRYFSKFEGTHYVPNKSLAENYPTDVAIIHEILSSQ